MSENDAIWQKIDNHANEIADVKENIHGISERMVLLENSLETSIKSQTEGHTEIKTLLTCLQKDVSKLNDDKLLRQGYEQAKKEHNRVVKWIIGVFATLASGGSLSIYLFGDKLN